MKSIVKISFVLLTTLVLTMCNKKQNDQKSTTQSTENFDWLLGNWKRTNEEKGKETFENWKKTNNNEYKGNGDKMNAIVSGDSLKLSFEFERIK